MTPHPIHSDRLKRTLANLDPNRTYPRVGSDAAVYLHILSAAQRHDVFEPFDPEARQLNDWLTKRRAGRELCRDAWDSFMAEGPFQLRTPRKSA